MSVSQKGFRADLAKCFPHPELRVVQGQALEQIASSKGGIVMELPTGSGKTAVGLAVLKALGERTGNPVMYTTPTKTQVEQIVALHSNDVQAVVGRSEYPCLYYQNRGQEGVSAEGSPCAMLQCGHRVDLETGQTAEAGVEPCPYFLAKHRARQRAAQGKVVVCTTAFYLTQMWHNSEWCGSEPVAVVVDEVHRIARVTRDLFEHSVTDYHLGNIAELLKDVDGTKRQQNLTTVKRFRAAFARIARHKPAGKRSLLKVEEIERLSVILEGFNTRALEKDIRAAIANGILNPLEHRHELKQLETLSMSIPKLVRMLSYALAEEKSGRLPLNYVTAFTYEDRGENPHRRASYVLTVKSYYVVPIIRKVLGNSRVIAYSATIGDERHFQFETGLNFPIWRVKSSFAPENTRIFMPTDAKDLAYARQRKGDLNKTLRLVIRTAKRFAEKGHRSLVVVVSDEERQKFLKFSEEEGLHVVSYGNGVKPKEAALAFRRGGGDALVGTSANYSEGVDLPSGIAPIIFFLRPGYPSLDDPEAQFEGRRFSNGQVWGLRNWRVAIEALQTRGRNIRSGEDVGVCFFMSTQFRRFLYGSLPEWLRSSYDGKVTFDEAVEQAMKMLT